jgi:hypothetical protein
MSDTPQGALSVVPERTRKLILENIAPSEWVFIALVGARGQTLVALADRLLIAKAGFLAGHIFGGEVNTFMYREITGIGIETHLTTAVLQVQTASFAGTRAGGYWASDKGSDPFKLPNCVPLANKKALGAWQGHLATLRSGIAAGGFRPPTQAAARPAIPQQPARTITIPTVGRTREPETAIGISDEVKKLADLHAAGALTDEEFAQAKGKLLG